MAERRPPLTRLRCRTKPVYGKSDDRQSRSGGSNELRGLDYTVEQLVRMKDIGVMFTS